jgi:CRISPR-associated protein Csx10
MSKLEIGDFPERYFFALTLHSPLLLLDDLLRYQSYVDVKTLQKELFPCKLPGLELLYYASSLKRITGWQELWGTPRAGECAIDTGSVFLFTCSSPPDAECLRALFALEERGMGKRRVEGFGRVRMCDQFHQLVRQEL